VPTSASTSSARRSTSSVVETSVTTPKQWTVGVPNVDVRHAAARAMAARSEPELREEAGRLAAVEPDELVARAFAAAARRGER